MPESTEYNQPPVNLLTASRSLFNRFSRELGVLSILFVVSVTMAYLIDEWFDPPLLSVFDDSFEIFREWIRGVLYWTVMKWVAALLAILWYCLLLILSSMFHVAPYLPEIPIPDWLLDMSAVSLILTRVFQGVDLAIPRSIQAYAESRMPANWREELWKQEGPIWGRIHRCFDVTNALIWKVIESTAKRSGGSCRRIVRLILIGVASVGLFWGFIRLGGYVVNLWAARHIDSPVMANRRKFARFYVSLLLTALVCVALFFLYSGWVLDWERESGLRKRVSSPLGFGHVSFIPEAEKGCEACRNCA